MGEVTKALIWEELKDIDLGLDRIDGRLGMMISELDHFAIQMHGLTSDLSSECGDITSICVSLGHLDGRLKQIEKRLDIVEEPAE